MDGTLIADKAGLRHVSDEEPGIRRVVRGRGFSYHRPDGTQVTDAAAMERIESLVVPPAWRDVWICADERGHIQVTGRDEAGRKQYLYHPEWDVVRDEIKYDRLGDFGASLLTLRSEVDADLGRSGLPERKVVALVVWLLDNTLMRVGNVRYAIDNESFGLTTLRPEHAQVSGSHVVFEFVGKSGKDHTVAVDDRRIAGLVDRCRQEGGETLFTSGAGYDEAGSDGARVAVSSGDVNTYVQSIIGDEFTAKDFRTWGGTVTVARHLAEVRHPEKQGISGDEQADPDAAVIAAVDAAATLLGNTRTVVRSAYLHPDVETAYRTGRLAEAWSHSRSGRGMERAERAVLKIIG